MIYIKRFLYILFVIVMSIIGTVIFFISIITFPFVSMVNYIVYGELPKDYVMKVCEWLGDVLYKFEPE